MEKFISRDAELSQLFKRKGVDLVLVPNADPAGSVTASTAAHHGDFDDDPATVKSTLARVLGAAAQGPAKAPADPGIEFHRSASRLRERRAVLDDARLRRG
jgi:hypothetical protein